MQNVSHTIKTLNCKCTGAPEGQPEIQPSRPVVGIQSNVTLTCNTDQMDEGHPPISYSIWTKVIVSSLAL